MLGMLKSKNHWKVITHCLLMGLISAACEYVFYWIRRATDALKEEV